VETAIKPTYRKILALALPIMFSQLVINIIGVTDMVFLGRVGTIELNAAGLTSLFYAVSTMVGLGLSRGTQILISKRLGEKRLDEIGSLAWNFMISCSILHIFILTILYFFTEEFLGILIKDPEIIKAGCRYLDYRIWGLLPSVVSFLVLAFYTGIGNNKVIYYSTFIVVVTNVILNYGLIFGTWGLPEMGIAGAGLASTIAEFLAVIFASVYMLMDKSIKSFNLFNKIGFNTKVQKNITNISLPLILQYLVGLGSWLIFFSFIEKMGEIPLAVSIVMRWIYSFLMIPTIGFATVINTLISNNLGMKNLEYARISLKKVSVVSFVMVFAISLLLFIIPNQLAAIFTDKAIIISEAPHLFPLLFGILILTSLSSITFNAVVGAGATRVTLVIQCLTVVAYLVYAYFIVHVFQKGLGWVWFADGIYWLILMILSIAYLARKKWMKSFV